MESLKTRGKKTLINQPYRAPCTELIGRETELNMILAAWIQAEHSPPLSPLLLGPPGVGKNRIVYECARICRKELYIFQGHEDMTAEDFACTARFSDDSNRKVEYVLSALVTAMIRGGICFVDEIGKVRPRALAPLASVLDERRYIDSTILGERVLAHPGFRFIAATNPTDFETHALPEFIRSRSRPVIEVSYPSREEIDAIARSRMPRLAHNANALLGSFWKLWRSQQGDRMPTPRDVIYIFGLAMNLADFEAAPRGDGHDPLCPPPSKLQESHLEVSFRQLVPD